MYLYKELFTLAPRGHVCKIIREAPSISTSRKFKNQEAIWFSVLKITPKWFHIRG